MVKEVVRESKTYYACEECGLLYRDEAMAEKCQAWCAEHKSCNLDIIKYAVNDENN